MAPAPRPASFPGPTLPSGPQQGPLGGRGPGPPLPSGRTRRGVEGRPRVPGQAGSGQTRGEGGYCAEQSERWAVKGLRVRCPLCRPLPASLPLARRPAPRRSLSRAACSGSLEEAVGPGWAREKPGVARSLLRAEPWAGQRGREPGARGNPRLLLGGAVPSPGSCGCSSGFGPAARLGGAGSLWCGGASAGPLGRAAHSFLQGVRWGKCSQAHPERDGDPPGLQPPRCADTAVGATGGLGRASPTRPPTAHPAHAGTGHRLSCTRGLGVPAKGGSQ